SNTSDGLAATVTVALTESRCRSAVTPSGRLSGMARTLPVPPAGGALEELGAAGEERAPERGGRGGVAGGHGERDERGDGRHVGPAGEAVHGAAGTRGRDELADDAVLDEGSTSQGLRSRSVHLDQEEASERQVVAERGEVAGDRGAGPLRGR